MYDVRCVLFPSLTREQSSILADNGEGAVVNQSRPLTYTYPISSALGNLLCRRIELALRTLGLGDSLLSSPMLCSLQVMFIVRSSLGYKCGVESRKVYRGVNQLVKRAGRGAGPFSN